MRNVEEWRFIPNCEGIYQASSSGRIRSVNRTLTDSTGKTRRLKSVVLSPAMNSTGYLIVRICLSSGQETRKVHQLVASAFIGIRPPGMDTCHNDGDRTNNSPSNLRYDTRGNNILDTNGHGTNWARSKTQCPRGHALSEPNLTIDSVKRGHRVCLSCSRAHKANYKKKVKYGVPLSDSEFKARADRIYESLVMSDREGNRNIAA